MKDFAGQELNVGNFVAFMRPGYRELVLGRIIKITPQQIRVNYWNDIHKRIDEFLTYSRNAVRVESSDALVKILNGESNII